MAALFGVAFSLGGIVLEVDPVRGTRGHRSRSCAALYWVDGAPWSVVLFYNHYGCCFSFSLIFGSSPCYVFRCFLLNLNQASECWIFQKKLYEIGLWGIAEDSFLVS